MKRLTHLGRAVTFALLPALLLIALIGMLSPADATGNTIKVPDDYPTIQAAIDAAAEGDTILVSRVDNYLENLTIDKELTLSGGWDASFTTQDSIGTTIDGQGLGRVISITAATSGTIITIEGFTIQNGNATGLGGAPVSASAAPTVPVRGASVDFPQNLDANEQMAQLSARLADAVATGLCDDRSPFCQSVLDRAAAQIEQFDGTQVHSPVTTGASLAESDCGGGIYVRNTGLTLLNSRIQFNVASMDMDGRGGGVCVVEVAPNMVNVTGNMFRENIATAAAVTGANTTGEGGGLYVLNTPQALIADNRFELNTANDAGFLGNGIGGGVMLWQSSDSIVEDNEIVRNIANAGTVALHGLGGGLYVGQSNGVKIVGNLMNDNLAVVHGSCAGGGLMVNGSADVFVGENEVAKNVSCFFQMDMGGAGGGGMSLYGIDAISVTGNLVEDNRAVLSGAHIGFSVGGGLDGENWFSASRIVDNEFTGNMANPSGIGRGGGVSIWGSYDAYVAENKFIGNVGSMSTEVDGAGGGLFLLNTMRGSVLGNLFEGNVASFNEGDGGGMSVREEGPKNFDLVVDANTFRNNLASPKSGDLATGGACSIAGDGVTFTNNLVVGNQGNAGLYLPFVKRASVVNNTVVKNHNVDNNGAGILLDQWNLGPITLTNNIVVSHTVGISVTEGATATIRYTLLDGNDTDIGGGGLISETHTVTGTPDFVDPANVNYHLGVGSAAVDAGDPAGVPPAPDHDLDGVTRPHGLAVDIGAYEWLGKRLYLPMVIDATGMRSGWAIGTNETGGIGIVHTSDSGQTWEAQGDPALLQNLDPGDISAVDAETAWAAALSSDEPVNGVILKTTDGGTTWMTQTVPVSVTGGIKGIKGLSRTEAWAASLDGVVLHTTDGGDNWVIVPHPTAPISQVNRIDAMGTHVWIADTLAGGAMVHSMDSGATWRSEYLPNGDYPLTVHAFSPSVVWASGTDLEQNPTFYRTVDGGEQWAEVKNVGGLDHLDDICAGGIDYVWGALNGNGAHGRIWRVHITPDGTSDAEEFDPPELGRYPAGGATCLNERVAWIVAHGDILPDPSAPKGYIVHTTDGGTSWGRQTAPANIHYWKISMVGALR